jgi:hypothetical protein
MEQMPDSSRAPPERKKRGMTLNDAMRALEEARASLLDAKLSMNQLHEMGAVPDDLREATSRLMDGVHSVEARLAQQVGEQMEV